METRFINGNEYVDKATYIQTRDRLGQTRERVAELEQRNTFWACKHHRLNNTLRCAICDEVEIKRLRERLLSAQEISADLKIESNRVKATLRWVVENEVCFAENNGKINAWCDYGGCCYDEPVPDEHWENIENLFVNAKLDETHRVKEGK